MSDYTGETGHTFKALADFEGVPEPLTPAQQAEVNRVTLEGVGHKYQSAVDKLASKFGEELTIAHNKLLSCATDLLACGKENIEQRKLIETLRESIYRELNTKRRYREALTKIMAATSAAFTQPAPNGTQENGLRAAYQIALDAITKKEGNNA